VPAPDERRAWIALASVKGIGDILFGVLLARFGNAGAVLDAALGGTVGAWNEERRRLDGRAPLNRPVLDDLVAVAREPVERRKVIDQAGLWTITALDADYPARLRDLDPPPPVIHGLGNPRALHGVRAVGVVGTRRPTPAGRALAVRVAARLVECRATVVSGLAVGIDGVAHATTIERRGQTVAVIGAGHHSPGPRAHARLRNEIVAGGGALISEHHPWVEARKGTYPRRNRIIAALSDSVIVIEAPATSGARITARLALELGRHVLIAPGRVGDWATAGSLALLRESPARPLVGLDEMVADLGFFEPLRDAGEPVADSTIGAGTAREPALAMLGRAERLVARRLCDGPAGLDLLVAETGLGPAVVSSAVTLLLMRGWVQSVGPAYIAAGPLAA